MPGRAVSGTIDPVSDRTVEVPNEVRQKARAQGAEGIRWLNRLGDVIDQLERDWEVTVGATLYGGSESYVAAARTSGGAEGVIKIAIPGNALSNEVKTLLLADGHGYVRLLKHDEARRAMLQERLGPSLAELALPIKTQIEIICATLHRAWEVGHVPSSGVRG